MINFTYKGVPKALKRHRVARNGRMYDPSHADKKEIWLQIAKFRPKRPFAGNIYLKVIFHMPRPKHHFKTKAGKPTDIVKEKYKSIKLHSYKPDLDNLVKMLADCIGNNTFICDDSQICWLSAVKQYGEPKTEVTIEELP